jgi:cathepsin A (carboxypeptidase C)
MVHSLYVAFRFLSPAWPHEPFYHFQQLGLNPYDVRRKCNREKDGDLCYEQMGWIEKYLNDDRVKMRLGVDPERTFQSCNMQVNSAFTSQVRTTI